MPVLTKINTNVIADDAVTSAKIPADAVIASDIAAGAVGSSEIAAGAVGTSEINSTGQTGGTKFLREDGDGTVSWQPAVSAPTITSVTFHANSTDQGNNASALAVGKELNEDDTVFVRVNGTDFSSLVTHYLYLVLQSNNSTTYVSATLTKSQESSVLLLASLSPSTGSISSGTVVQLAVQNAAGTVVFGTTYTISGDPGITHNYNSNNINLGSYAKPVFTPSQLTKDGTGNGVCFESTDVPTLSGTNPAGSFKFDNLGHATDPDIHFYYASTNFHPGDSTFLIESWINVPAFTDWSGYFLRADLWSQDASADYQWTGTNSITGHVGYFDMSLGYLSQGYCRWNAIGAASSNTSWAGHTWTYGSVDTWYHYAIFRSGTRIHFMVNGTVADISDFATSSTALAGSYMAIPSSFNAVGSGQGVNSFIYSDFNYTVFGNNSQSYLGISDSTNDGATYTPPTTKYVPTTNTKIAWTGSKESGQDRPALTATGDPVNITWTGTASPAADVAFTSTIPANLTSNGLTFADQGGGDQTATLTGTPTSGATTTTHSFNETGTANTDAQRVTTVSNYQLTITG